MELGVTQRMRFCSDNVRKEKDKARIEEILVTEDGVRDVEVDPDSHEISIAFDPTVTSALKIRGMLESHGIKFDPEAVTP